MNEFNKITTNARLTGVLLGILIESNFRYKKSVSLVGFGHGSLVIENCLKHLGENKCQDSIMNVAYIHGILSVSPFDFT